MTNSIQNQPMERKTTTSPERAIAAFLGAAVGDALGWPFEGRAASEPNVRDWNGKFVAWNKRAGNRYAPVWEQVGPGEYSDDTQLILAVARARMACQEWWKYFTHVELPFWTCYERGGGGATKRATNAWRRGIAPWEAKSRNGPAQYFEAGGNGAAMRVLPHCVSHADADDFSALAVDVLSDAVTTHGHPRALLGALAFAYIMWKAFRRTEVLDYGSLLQRCIDDAGVWGALPDITSRWPSWHSEAMRHSSNYLQMWEETVDETVNLCRRALGGLNAGALSDDRAILSEIGGLNPKTNGAGTTTAVGAIYFASRYAASPAEGLHRAASATGADTDTLASMTASLLGVVGGVAWLEPHLPQLQDGPYIRRVAEDLTFKRQSKATHSNFGGRDVVKFVAQLCDWNDEMDISLPIGGRVKSVRSEQGNVGPKVTNRLRVLTDSGLTLFIRSNEVDKRADKGGASSSHSEPAVGMSLLVRDLGRSRDFYENYLGLRVSGVTQKVVRFSSTLALRADETATPSCSGLKIFINVGDVESCYRRLVEAGQVTSRLMERGNTRSFECNDPDGYPIEVFERLMWSR